MNDQKYQTGVNKQCVIRETLVVIALLSIATFFFFPGAFFQGKTLLQADLLYYYSPWREIFPEMRGKPGNWILFDELFQFTPWREFTKESYLNGRIPLWDPSGFCGYPFAAALQPGVFYIPDILFLPFSSAALPAWRGLFHIILAGIGMFWFLRLLPARFSSALLGGLLFPFCGFMIAWFGHPHFKVAAWLPWLFFAVNLTARQPTILRGLFLTVVFTMQILGGHIETSAHLFIVTGLYSLYILGERSTQRTRFFVIFSAAVLFSMLLAAIQLVPFCEYLINSSAFHVRKHGVWGGTFFPVSFLICFIMPRFFGSTADGINIMKEFSTNEVLGGFTGVIPLILALSTIVLIGKDRQITRIGILCFFCLAVIFKVPPIFELLHIFPIMKMSYNFRLVLIQSFTVITLCILALDRICDGSLRVVHVLIVWFIITTAGTLAYIVHTDTFSKAGISGYALLNFRHFLIFAILVPPVLVLMKLRCRSVYVMPVLMLLCFANIWIESSNFHRSYQSGLLYPRPGILDRIPFSDQPYRLLPLGQTLPPHTSIQMRFHDIRGYDALTPLCIEEYLSLVDPSIDNPRLLPLLRLFSLKTFHHALIDGLNVHYIMTPQSTGLSFWQSKAVPPADQYTLIASEYGVSLYRNCAARPRAYVTGQFHMVQGLEESRILMASPDFTKMKHIVIDTDSTLPPADGQMISGHTEISRYGPTRIDIVTANHGPGLLVLSDTFFPGWTVRVDGKDERILRVNHALRGVRVSSGPHTVTFSYRPFSFRIGCYITLCGLLFILMFVSVFFPYQRKAFRSNALLP